MSKSTEKKEANKKPSKIDKLNSRIKELEKQNEEYHDKLLRIKAEFDNSKKRLIKEQEQVLKYASSGIIERLLPIVDDLERALSAIDENLEAGKIIDGVKLTHKDMKNLLEENFVIEINPVGKPFDPNEQEAVLTIHSDTHDEDCVVEVFQKGYKLNGKIVRPARVSICKKK